MKNLQHMLVASTAVLAVLTATPADAEDTSRFDYTYVEAQFLHTNFDTDEFTISAAGTTGTFTDATSNGFGLEGAFGSQMFAENVTVYTVADYMSFDTDLGVSLQGTITGNGFVPVDFTEWRLGAGVAYEATPRFALTLEGGYLSTKAEFGSINGLGGPIGLQGFDLSSAGLDVRLGFRAAPIDQVELFGFVRHNPHGEIENTGAAAIEFVSEFRYTLGGRYRFTEHFSAGAEYEYGEPGTARLSVRYSF